MVGRPPHEAMCMLLAWQQPIISVLSVVGNEGHSGRKFREKSYEKILQRKIYACNSVMLSIILLF